LQDLPCIFVNSGLLRSSEITIDHLEVGK
jgi:hypothetical protein